MSMQSTLQLVNRALDAVNVPPGETIKERVCPLSVNRYCEIAPAALMFILDELGQM